MRDHRARVAAMALVVLGAAGCEGQDEPTDRLAAAAQATGGQRSAAFALDVATRMGEDGSVTDMTMAGQGVIDFDAERGHMTTDLPGTGLSIKTVFADDVVYSQLPPMFGDLGGDWIRQAHDDVDTPGMATGMGGGTGLGGTPADMVAALDAVDGEVEGLGSDDVRGTEVEGFAFTWTGGDVAESEDVPESFAELEMPTRVWLDADDRVRRMITEVDLPAVRMGEVDGTMTVTVELFDFGTDVDVDVPDEADVIDAEDIEDGMGEGEEIGALSARF